MSPSRSTRSSRQIVIVEDDAAVLHSLQYALEIHGYEVLLFDRAAAALDSGEAEAANCLLIDYALPDIDGLTLLEQFRQRGVTCPAVIIASNPGPRCRVGATAAGAVLLEKPIMGERLNDLLRRILS